MQNKKAALIAIASILFLIFVVACVFIFQRINSAKENTLKKTAKTSAPVLGSDADILKQFVEDLPCGVTDFDSPQVKPVTCAPDKMKKGEPVEVKMDGIVADENGMPISGVKLVANNGTPFYSDDNGLFQSAATVDSNKGALLLVGDKEGYSPFRKIFMVQEANADRTALEIKKDFHERVTLRKVEVQKINLGENEITITSQKYPGVSVTIPAGGLVNAKGEAVSGEVTGEITYLNPNDPKDIPFVPGFNATSSQMIGVDGAGNEVVIKSDGMVFFHFKQVGSDEILQPKKGIEVTITQPIPESELKIITDPKIVESQQLGTNTELRNSLDEGLKSVAGLTEQQIIDKRSKDGNSGLNYWYFNERTGLWEAWAVGNMSIDFDKKIYIIKAVAFY